jgi:hypothetical protein
MLNAPMPETLTKLSENASGTIYETHQFKDGLFFVKQIAENFPHKRKAALLDLDNTVVSYRHTLGTDHWFDFDFNDFMQRGLNASETKAQVLPLYLDVVRRIHPDDVYAVEEDTPAIIREMQQNGIETLALTSRGSYLLQETIDQLARFQINFNQGTYANKEKKLAPSEEGLFTQGMILTGGQHKGKCLLMALEELGDLPDFMIMWDDKLSNLERVRDSIQTYNTAKITLNPNFTPVQFIGIRYSKLDHLVNKVDPRVTELQKKYFQRVLSDEHALAIAKADQKKTRQLYIGIDFQPQNDSVVVSCHKHAIYEKLAVLCPDLAVHEKRGAVKDVYGKKKLAFQFQFTVREFEVLFHQLSQHGMIEPEQFILLDPIFNPPRPVLSPLLDLQRAQAQAQAAQDEALLNTRDQLANITLDRRLTNPKF